MAQATTAVQPSSEFIEMSRRIPFMPSEQLGPLTASPMYGALALVEISKRNRTKLMKEAQQQAQQQAAAAGGGNTIADKEIAALAQSQFREKLANDERMGLNNIVAQAEQGGLEFGQPVEMAGGGMIAFDRGGEVPGFAVGALIPAAMAGARAIGPMAVRGLSGLRGLMARYPKTTAGIGVASGVPFGLGALGDDKEAFSPEEYQRQYEAQGMQEGRSGAESRSVAARGEARVGTGNRGSGISGLDVETDPRKIKELREQLEKEAGLGEFGAKAKEIREGRKAKVEETLGRALKSEPFMAAAEAVGAAKPTGRRGLAGLLDVAAPALTAASKSAAGIQRQRTEALDKLAEGEERLALAEEQYRRGNIKDYITESRQAKKDLFTSNIQLRQLEALENYRQQQLGLLQARVQAAAQGRSGMRGADFDKLEGILSSKSQELQGLMKDPKKNKDKIAKLEQEILGYQSMIRAGMVRNLSGGISISDEPD